MNTLQATSVGRTTLQTTTPDGMNTLQATLDRMNTLQATSVRMKTLQTTTLDSMNKLQATLDSILRHRRFIYPRYQRSWHVLLGGIICFIKTLSPPFFKRPIWITNFPCDTQTNVQTHVQTINMSSDNYHVDKAS